MLIWVVYPIRYTSLYMNMHLVWLKCVNCILFLVTLWYFFICTILATIYWIYQFFLGHQDIYLKTCSIIYLLLRFLYLIMMFYLFINISLLVTDSSTIFSSDFWPISKEETLSQSWATRTYSLPYYLPVFISKLS